MLYRFQTWVWDADANEGRWEDLESKDLDAQDFEASDDEAAVAHARTVYPDPTDVQGYLQIRVWNLSASRSAPEWE